MGERWTGGQLRASRVSQPARMSVSAGCLGCLGCLAGCLGWRAGRSFATTLIERQTGRQKSAKLELGGRQLGGAKLDDTQLASAR